MWNYLFWSKKLVIFIIMLAMQMVFFFVIFRNPFRWLSTSRRMKFGSPGNRIQNFEKLNVDDMH